MSQHAYTVLFSANGDMQWIIRDDNVTVLWNDPDFQSWNNAQATPAQLSAIQVKIQALKQMTYPAWQANVTPAEKDRILFELVQRALRNEIV